MEPYESMPQSINENENSIIPMVYNLQATSENYNLIHDEYLPSCNIDLSTDPYVNKHTIELQNKGNHPTQGTILHAENVECQKATTAAKIKHW